MTNLSSMSTPQYSCFNEIVWILLIGFEGPLVVYHTSELLNILTVLSSDRTLNRDNFEGKHREYNFD